MPTSPLSQRVWLFDLDDTLHDASTASLPHLHVSFGEYIRTHLGLDQPTSDALRRQYWLRYCHPTISRHPTIFRPK
jgi:putative hydrolase of the HAD superfamily